jgi:hypothetical protein
MSLLGAPAETRIGIGNAYSRSGDNDATAGAHLKAANDSTQLRGRVARRQLAHSSAGEFACSLYGLLST